jgi:ABC-type transport system involved in multi-copper enzyme maturation permease subunit
VTWDPGALIDRGEVLGGVVAFYSVVAGLAAGHVLWSADDRIGHTYALSLPIGRRRFVWWRAAGGLLALCVPALAVWIGSIAAISTLELPPALHAYPTWFALRAYAAMTMGFAAMFLFRFGMTRRVRAMAFALAFLLITVMIIESEALNISGGPINRAARLLVAPASPLSLLFSRWPLVDV